MAMELIHKNIGITGSNGFIGSHLKKHLDARKIKYTCFNGDLLKEEDIKRYFSKNKVDQIIHLVGSFDLPFENQIKMNLLTTQKLLEVGVNYGLKKIIFSSTGAVYGEPLKGKSSENDPLRPNTLYGLSKMYAEEVIEYYSDTFGLQFIILRFPNVYGGGNNKGVVYNFLSDIRNKGKITIHGNGKQSRNFLYVTDACQAIEKSLFYKKSDIFNISNPVKTSINDLIEKLNKRYSFEINYEKSNNNLKDLLLNIDKATNKLKFIPKRKDILIS